MAPKTVEQYEHLRKARRKQIMETALRLFAANGYTNTSISQIAQKAGISKGLMYNYFSGKEELLRIIFEEGFEEMMNFFDPNKDGVLTQEEFEFFINETFHLMDRKRDFYKLYFTLMMQPAVWKKLKIKIHEIIEPWLKIMTDYYKKKGVENPGLEAILMGALLDGIGFNFVFNPDMYPLEEVKKLVIKRFV